MKRSRVYDKMRVLVNTDGMVCDKCHHDRRGEPYVRQIWFDRNHTRGQTDTCWRCCRDAESTFLIRQKWPLAFERFDTKYGWYLAWAPGVKSLVGAEEEE